MNDQEFVKAVRFALDEPESRFSIFMRRVAGYRFFHKDSPICVPKYVLYERFKNYPHALELLEQGLLPDYKKACKEDFDEIKMTEWTSQSESQPTTDQTF